MGDGDGVVREVHQERVVSVGITRQVRMLGDLVLAGHYKWQASTTEYTWQETRQSFKSHTRSYLICDELLYFLNTRQLSCNISSSSDVFYNVACDARA